MSAHFSPLLFSFVAPSLQPEEQSRDPAKFERDQDIAALVSHVLVLTVRSGASETHDTLAFLTNPCEGMIVDIAVDIAYSRRLALLPFHV